MDLMTARCIVSLVLSFAFSKSFNILFISLEGITLFFKVTLCPKLRKKNARSAIFSSLGMSCTLYTNTPSFLMPLDIFSATFLFAKSMNSSINLFESPRSFLITFIGTPFSFKTNFTSIWSSDIAPCSNLSFVNFFAKLFKIKSSLWNFEFVFFIVSPASS